MKTELIESLDFTEEDYNEKIAGEDVASFNEFIDAIIVFVEQNGGTLEDVKPLRLCHRHKRNAPVC